MLPHPGGFFDQPSTFVKLTMELHGYVAAYQKEEQDRMDREAKAAASRGSY